MKKLKLNNVNFGGARVLSRAELRRVMGGEGSGICNSLSSGCPVGYTPNVCYIDSSCPYGTLICTGPDGCDGGI